MPKVSELNLPAPPYGTTVGEVVSLGKAAEQIGASRTTLNTAVESGRIQGYRNPGESRVLVLTADVVQLGSELRPNKRREK